MAFRAGNHPEAEAMDPIKGVAKAELQVARKHLMRALKAVDGDCDTLAADRAAARHLILQAVPLVDSAHLFLGGSEQGE